MNAGIQGLAADIFKVALIRLDAALAERDAASRIVLQVHDEVILEVPPAEHDDIGALTRDVMRGACELRVPLGVPMAVIERAAIEETLRHCDYDKAACARMLGIGLRTLYRKLGQYAEDDARR